MKTDDKPAEFEVSTDTDGSVQVRLSGRWMLSGRLPPSASLAAALPSGSCRVSFCSEGISAWDTGLLTFMVSACRICGQRDQTVDLAGLPPGVRRLLELATAVPPRREARQAGRELPFAGRVGERAIERAQGSIETLSFVGETFLSMVRFLRGRASYRRTDFWLTIQACGPRALPIVSTISILVGLILAFVGAIQLRAFGASIFVADLVGLGMVLEMGALMTGIILAGRTGASFAAQLGTMQVNEEIDALRTLGLSPIDYLVLPRMLALMLMTPLLCAYANVLGILGGSLVGIFMLGIPPVQYFQRTVNAITFYYCAQGMIKASVFGVLIALASCLRGMQSGRSASAVGDAATSAVVTSIMFIVLSDAILTFIFLVTG